MPKKSVCRFIQVLRGPSPGVDPSPLDTEGIFSVWSGYVATLAKVTWARRTTLFLSDRPGNLVKPVGTEQIVSVPTGGHLFFSHLLKACSCMFCSKLVSRATTGGRRFFQV